jgi:hypothetical protein
MSLLKWLKANDKKGSEARDAEREVEDDHDGRGGGGRDGEGGRDGDRKNQDAGNSEGTKIVYFVCDTPKENIINIIQSLDKGFQVSSFLYYF